MHCFQLSNINNQSTTAVENVPVTQPVVSCQPIVQIGGGKQTNLQTEKIKQTTSEQLNNSKGMLHQWKQVFQVSKSNRIINEIKRAKQLVNQKPNSNGATAIFRCLQESLDNPNDYCSRYNRLSLGLDKKSGWT